MASTGIRFCLMALLTTALAAPRARAHDHEDDSRSLQIKTLSTHADRVSGGDVLVQITVPRQARHVIVSLNGRVVTSAFRETAPGTLVGLVTGLALGDNRLPAEAKGAGTNPLRLVNYPITGPIVSGPHEQIGPHKLPFICQTNTFLLPDGSPL